MRETVRWHDHITINIYWLGLSTCTQTLTPLVIPLLVQHFVGEADKGAFLGTLRLWTLMMALLSQALAGMLSDHSTLRWGRRRPFILLGAAGKVLLLATLIPIAGLEGLAGYRLLFAVAVLWQLFSNTAQGSLQGLIPDLVPEARRGRFSGIKAALEVPLPLILVALTVGPLISAGRMREALLVAMGVLAVSLALSMLVREEPLKKPPPLDWSAFLRLLLMTGFFTALILAMGASVRQISALAARLDSPLALVGVMGAAGLLAIAVTVVLGVWVSVCLGIGGAVRQHPSFSWWVTNRLAFLVGANNLAGFALYFLQARLGLFKEEAAGPASRLIMIVGIMVLLAAAAGGWLVDRFDSRRLVALGGVVAALGTLVTILFPNLWTIYAGGVLIGAGIGIFFTANWALGTTLAPGAEAGRYLGISNLAGAGAGAVGAYIGGPIADLITAHVPEVPGLGYVVIFALYGLLFLLSPLALIWVREGA